jgi:5-methylcytosine-specific restriction endonuclease McrA
VNNGQLARQFRLMWQAAGGGPRLRPAGMVKVAKVKKPKEHRPRKCNPLSPSARRRALELASGPGWTPEQWSALLLKHGKRCLKCGSTDRIVADHVVPMKRGGQHCIDNIQPLCNKCNIVKGLKVVDYR